LLLRIFKYYYIEKETAYEGRQNFEYCLKNFDGSVLAKTGMKETEQRIKTRSLHINHQIKIRR
jgi:hypothetical protein